MKLITVVKPLAIFGILLIISIGLISCGGGGDSSSGGGATVASGGGGDADSEGDDSGGDADGGNGGEGAGACRSLNLERFAFNLVREHTQPSAPPNEKKLTISTPAASGDDSDAIFTTNDGKVGDGCAEAECLDPTFVAEYEQAFGVYNTDCRL